jgi:hypothetical protein
LSVGGGGVSSPFWPAPAGAASGGGGGGGAAGGPGPPPRPVREGVRSDVEYAHYSSRRPIINTQVINDNQVIIPVIASVYPKFFFSGIQEGNTVFRLQG